MTFPARGTFTQDELNVANGSPVSLQDAQEITLHDEPHEDQWCFIPCEYHQDKINCEANNCYWYNDGCYTEPPTCTELTSQNECIIYGCFWYNGTCHAEQPSCETLADQVDCQAYGCYWYNGSCHSEVPTCGILNNESDCDLYQCFWYRGVCNSVDQPELCYWIDSKGGPVALVITDIFIIIDSFLFMIPPDGWGFVPTILEVFGVIDYYLGFNGDPGTGCNYGVR